MVQDMGTNTFRCKSIHACLGHCVPPCLPWLSLSPACPLPLSTTVGLTVTLFTYLLPLSAFVGHGSWMVFTMHKRYSQGLVVLFAPCVNLVSHSPSQAWLQYHVPQAHSPWVQFHNHALLLYLSVVAYSYVCITSQQIMQHSVHSLFSHVSQSVYSKPPRHAWPLSTLVVYWLVSAIEQIQKKAIQCKHNKVYHNS